MPTGCIFCEEIDRIKNNITDPYFVVKLETGYVSIAHNQYYEGYCLFISNIHASELHEIDMATRKQFLNEMVLVGEAIFNAFKPRKLNIELLGNSESHVHWHIIPRYKNDRLPKIPAWNNPEFLMNKKRPTESELESIKNTLLKSLDEVIKRNNLKL